MRGKGRGGAFPSFATSTSVLTSCARTSCRPASRAPSCAVGTSTLRPFDARSFRACFATWCAPSGFGSARIDAWLGHAPKTSAAKPYVKGHRRADERGLPDAARPTGLEPAGEFGAGVSGSILTVRRKGLEPLQELPHWNLNPARLPIPPPSHAGSAKPTSCHGEPRQRRHHTRYFRHISIARKQSSSGGGSGPPG